MTTRARWRLLGFGFGTLLATACGSNAPAANPTSAVASPPSEPVFEALAVGPLTYATPLQIVSVFPYEASETLVSPATEVTGFVADARLHQGFGAEPMKTLVVTPTPSIIKAATLLTIAWGPRASFSVARAKEMGHAAMHEALARKVEAVAYAPIARDQGVTSLDADVVAAAFIEGAVVELLSEEKAEPRRPVALKRVTYEAGPAFVEAVTKAVARGVVAGHASAASP
jgi:hypothetical protein